MSRFLTFQLSGEEYGIEILDVHEIIGVLPMTRVPMTPHCVRGVINLRGSVIPVVDLKRLFSLRDATAEGCIVVVRVRGIDLGVVVDRVSDVVELAPEAIQPGAGLQCRSPRRLSHWTRARERARMPAARHRPSAPRRSAHRIVVGCVGRSIAEVFHNDGPVCHRPRAASGAIPHHRDDDARLGRRESAARKGESRAVARLSPHSRAWPRIVRCLSRPRPRIAERRRARSNDRCAHHQQDQLFSRGRALSFFRTSIVAARVGPIAAAARLERRLFERRRAFTIAMLVREVLPPESLRGARVLATDISSRMLARAAAAEYREDALADVPDYFRERHFSANNAGAMRVADQTRAMVRFARLNLMNDWPMRGTFDAIFCRNVMIYFDRETQERLVRRFARSLSSGGFLFVGHSESLSGLDHGMRYVQPAVYAK